MTVIQQLNSRPSGVRRLVLWAALPVPLICTLVAMQFTNEVRWGTADFAAAGALLFSLGVAIELAFLLPGRPRTRSMLIGASVLTIMLIWADAAVGIF